MRKTKENMIINLNVMNSIAAVTENVDKSLDTTETASTAITKIQKKLSKERDIKK